MKISKSFIKKAIGLAMAAICLCTSSTTGIKAATDTSNVFPLKEAYTSMGGICIGPQGKSAFVVKSGGKGSNGKKNGTGGIYKVNISTGKVQKSVTGVTIGHGNDITYYNEKIYITNGPGDGGTSANTIYSYTKNLVASTTYTCKYKVGTIANIPGTSYFIAGQSNRLYSGTNNLKYYVGTFNDTTKTFDITTSFTITVTGLTNSKPVKQGICIYNGRLYLSIYKPDSKKKANQHNTIYSVKLNIGSDYTSVTTSDMKSFKINKSKLKKYEVESMYILNGTMYYSANVKKCDGVYKITNMNFNNY